VEGAISSIEDEHKIKLIRERTKTLIAMGDCAITSNVPGMRNPFGSKEILDRAYFENADLQQQVPSVVVPKLHEKVRPVHEFVHVDVFLPGCPPSADTFYTVLTDLLAGRTPDIASLTRFGA
jgi:NAD-reducing hydrogenase small subunit